MTKLVAAFSFLLFLLTQSPAANGQNNLFRVNEVAGMRDRELLTQSICLYFPELCTPDLNQIKYGQNNFFYFNKVERMSGKERWPWPACGKRADRRG